MRKCIFKKIWHFESSKNTYVIPPCFGLVTAQQRRVRGYYDTLSSQVTKLPKKLNIFSLQSTQWKRKCNIKPMFTFVRPNLFSFENKGETYFHNSFLWTFRGGCAKRELARVLLRDHRNKMAVKCIATVYIREVETCFYFFIPIHIQGVPK